MKTTLTSFAVATVLLFAVPHSAAALPGGLAVSKQVAQSNVIQVHRRGWRHRHYRRYRHYRRPYAYYGPSYYHRPYYRPYRDYGGGYPYYRRGPRFGFFLGF